MKRRRSTFLWLAIVILLYWVTTGNCTAHFVSPLSLVNFLSHNYSSLPSKFPVPRGYIYISPLHLKLFVIYSTHKARTCVDILECPKMHLIGLCIYYVGLVNQARIVCVGFTVQRAQLHVFLSCFRSRWSFTSSVTPNAWADSELLTRWVCKH